MGVMINEGDITKITKTNGKQNGFEANGFSADVIDVQDFFDRVMTEIPGHQSGS